MKSNFYLLLLVAAGFCLLGSHNASAQFSLSGQLRTRSELLHGQGSPLSKSDKPAFFTSQRTRLNAGYKGYRTQFFVAVQDVRVWGQDASTNNRITNPALNGLMLHEAWGEISLLDTNQTKLGKEFALKIGRQELLYDDSRLLGNLDWLQQARRHDAALLKYGFKGLTAHIGIAYNQNRELRTGTLYDGVPNGYAAGTNGIGTMYKSMQFAYLGKKLKQGNASFLILKDDFQKYTLDTAGVRTIKNGTNKRVTFGPYLQTKLGKAWNLTASAYYQAGKDKDGKSLNAYMYSVRGMYGASQVFAIGPGFDYTSGTANGSRKNSSFDPLYGTPHKFWGQMDYFYAANGFGKGGLADFYINSVIKASEKLSIAIDLHQFSSAASIRNAKDEKLSANFGEELDIIATYNLTKTISFQGGYCTFLPTNSLAHVKAVKDPQKMANWAYLMINIKPEFLK
ncbi:alginate export family protein [Dyadobacter sp. LJ53]|uniref:alginate export family protein n=1 Tax=Dyadobacter chenwenxiniae TaxID=2906456 RepID=UPI001F1B66A4|nr:alginate export family protein [Dyadobacter chenwenxiniae]MCF0051863.1 alginate export family protein [Dyadobacter chenwenxiniae]